MYSPVTDESSCEHVRLVVKHTFFEYECLDHESPKLRRQQSAPALSFSSATSFSTLALDCKGVATPTASTPTTCLSVNGDDSESEEAPESPQSCEDNDGSSSEGHFSWATTVPRHHVHEWCGAMDCQRVPPAGHAFSVFSTKPAAPCLTSPTYSNNARVLPRGGYEVPDYNFSNMTLMVRNLAQDLTQPQLAQHLIDAGYRGLFDFIYMPMNLRAHGNFGYAFVNFKSHTIAVQVMTRMQSDGEADLLSCLRWTSMWSTCQGYSANVERYRNSPLMHEQVPMDCKPAIYDDYGNRIAFAPPTKNIPKPRIHRPKEAKVEDSA